MIVEHESTELGAVRRIAFLRDLRDVASEFLGLHGLRGLSLSVGMFGRRPALLVAGAGSDFVEEAECVERMLRRFAARRLPGRGAEVHDLVVFCRSRADDPVAANDRWPVELGGSASVTPWAEPSTRNRTELRDCLLRICAAGRKWPLAETE
jgi:hypothetical protein